MTINLYQDYLSTFNEVKTNELTEEYNNLLWDQITDINDKYQQMFDILYEIQNINNKNIDIDNMVEITSEKNKNDEKNEFLILKNESNENNKKHKISKFSYSYIKYLYEYLVVYTNIPDTNLKEGIITKIVSFVLWRK